MDLMSTNQFCNPVDYNQMVGQLHHMGCQNQHLALEVQNLKHLVSQLLAEKEKEKLSFQGKVQGLTKAHVATILEGKETTKTLKKEIADKNRIIEDLKKQLENKSSENSLLSRKVNKLEDFKKDLNVKNKNLNKEVIDMKKEKKELENKISKTSENLEKSVKAQKALKADKKLLVLLKDNSINMLSDKVVKMEETKKDLIETMTKNEENFTRLSKENQNLKNKITEISQEHSCAKEQLTLIKLNFNKLSEEKNTSIDVLKNEILKLKNHLGELKQDLKFILDENDSLHLLMEKKRKTKSCFGRLFRR